jgi:hypothetical protein
MGTVQEPQNPRPGSFDHTILHWEQVVVSHGHHKSALQAFFLTERLADFIRGEHCMVALALLNFKCSDLHLHQSGESLKEDTSFFRSVNQRGGLYVKYHCSAGPEDLSQSRRDPAIKAKSKRGKVALGKSCKVGCMMHFKVTQMPNTHPSVSKILCPTFQHHIFIATCKNCR